MKIRLTLSLLFLMSLIALPAYAQEAVITGRVTQEEGPPVANATVRIPELGISTTTDTDGRYTLTVPADAVKGQTVDVRVVASGLQSKTAKVTLASGTVTQDFVLGFAFGEDVVVGSRAPGAAAEKAVPVDVFTEEEIEKASASTETNQIIQKLTPSFNFPRPTISDGTASDPISCSCSSMASGGTRARSSTSTTPSAGGRAAWT
jgi:iron complex outermembrane recepter protein